MMSACENFQGPVCVCACVCVCVCVCVCARARAIHAQRVKFSRRFQALNVPVRNSAATVVKQALARRPSPVAHTVRISPTVCRCLLDLAVHLRRPNLSERCACACGEGHACLRARASAHALVLRMHWC